MRVPNRPHLLKLGSKGKEVRKIEKQLKETGYLKGPVDGFFDAKTQKAILAFKDDNGWDAPKPVAGNRLKRTLAAVAEGTEPKPPDGDPRPSPTKKPMKGASYNCLVGRDPKEVTRWLTKTVREKNLDFVQLQEINGYHQALRSIPGYKLITFPGARDRGESGILVRNGISVEGEKSIQSTEGWKSPDGEIRRPRAATSVLLGGWLRVVSVHAPPAIDFANGQIKGPEQRKKAYASLMEKVLGHAKQVGSKHPDQALLIGGDWNEPASSSGKWSPNWLASQAGMTKHTAGGIDWEMARGCEVTKVRHGERGGSDHRMVLFNVKPPGK